VKPIIKLQDVWKIYKLGDVDVNALKGINLEIMKGEFLVILGVSGSGKSTTLNLIGCLDLPSRGKVYLDSNDISKLSESALAQIRGRKIGFVFQTFNLIPALNSLENVALPMAFQGVDAAYRIKKARELLIKVGLGHRMNHSPNKLSGGERQRVAIARALVNDPEIILADEPTGNLDSETGTEIINILTDLHKEGRTIVMITHEAGYTKLAQRVCHLKDGQII
jgi:putative ABC transport system ATP-binding protein